MSNIKDTQKNITNQQGLIHKGISHISKTLPQTPSKTLVDNAQKIGTAVYMVSELFSADELSSQIRQKSLFLIESLFDNLIQDGNKMSLIAAQYNIYEMISYIDIAYHAGFVSEMNYSILLEKAEQLQKNIIDEQNNIDSNIKNGKSENIHLAEFFFENTETEKLSNNENLKDINNETKPTENVIEKEVVLEKEQSDIRDILPTITTKNVPYFNVKKPSAKKSKSRKRHDDILMIMKQKKNASINDICALIKNCSSKTIQRDLNALIKKGIVVKQGDRRWSVYNLR